MRSNDLALLDRVRREVLLPDWHEHPLRFHFLFSFFVGGVRRRGRRDFTLLYDGTDIVARAHDTEEVFLELERRLHLRVAQFPFFKTALRGTVLSVDGGAHLYVGDATETLISRAKSLQQGGARLLAPQYCLIDEDGLVHPYHNRSGLEAKLGLARSVQPQPLERVWATGADLGSVSSAHCTWLLFSHLLNVNDSPTRLKSLSEIVSKRSVTASSVEVN